MFNKGSDQLTTKAKEELMPVLKALKNYKDKLNINIVAFTDPSPVNPNPRLQRWWNNNRELSAQRALNVQSLFLEQGFPQDIVYITGKGSMAATTSKEQPPLSLDGNQVDTKIFNSARTISIRLESKDKQ
jgi:flagellar motor protein MotB